MIILLFLMANLTTAKSFLSVLRYLDGIYVNLISPVYPNITKDPLPPNMSLSEFGCYLAYMSAHHYLIQNPDHRLNLVLESDFRPYPDLFEFIYLVFLVPQLMVYGSVSWNIFSSSYFL